MKRIPTAVLLLMWIGVGYANQEISVDLPGGATMEFVWIEPGTFLMGTTEEQEQYLMGLGSLWNDLFLSERPEHEVEISQGFYLGKFEVTQGQWEAVMGTTRWSGKQVEANPNHPAVYISWNEWQEFVRRLEEAAGDASYRLPTEAEWEYAARAGTTTMWSFGDDAGRLGLVRKQVNDLSFYCSL